jgi:hypothetical protein
MLIFDTSLVFLDIYDEISGFQGIIYLTLMRLTAIARSVGVRNHAVVGESGKKKKYTTAVARVIIPVMIMSLFSASDIENYENESLRSDHCQGSILSVLICRVP